MHFLFFEECEKNVLQDKVRTLQIEEEACCKLKQRIQRLEGQISATQLCLDKEKAKYHSACRQQEVSIVPNIGYFDGLSCRPRSLSFFFLVVVLVGPVNAGKAAIFVKESRCSR